MIGEDNNRHIKSYRYVELSHLRHKNKDVPKVGHPLLFGPAFVRLLLGVEIAPDAARASTVADALGCWSRRVPD